MVNDLVKAVPMAHWNFGNIGGAGWSRLKTEPDSFPPWDKLKEAVFWKDSTRYQKTWDLLSGKLKKPECQLQQPLPGEGGGVEVLSMEFNQNDQTVTKVAAWGSVQALKMHRKVHVVMAECNVEGLPKGMFELLEENKDANLIIIGVEQGVYRALHQLNQYKQDHNQIWEWKTSMIHLFLREDVPLGQRKPSHLGVHRLVMIASPEPVKAHRAFLAVDYTWRTSILYHLLSLFELPMKGVFHTLLYVPTSTRPDKEVISRMGTAMAQIPTVQVSWVQTGELSALDISSTMKSICLASFSGSEQCQHEASVLKSGQALNSFTITKSEPQVKHTKKRLSAESLSQAHIEEAETQPQVQSEGPLTPQAPQGKTPVKAPYRTPRSKASARPEGEVPLSGLYERNAETLAKQKAADLESAAQSKASSARGKARSSSELSAQSGSGGSAKKKAKPSPTKKVDLASFPSE